MRVNHSEFKGHLTYFSLGLSMVSPDIAPRYRIRSSYEHMILDMVNGR